MINIDAKVKDSNGEICCVEGVHDDGITVGYGGSHAEDSDFLEHGTYTVIEDIRSELEQQKQRADELEKRWSELVDVLKKKYEYYKVRADDESAEPVEQEKWRIAKHEMMMTLMAMADLQENNNA